VWLQWALSRPNSAFRDEMVVLNHTTIQANLLESLARDLLGNVGKNGNDSDQDTALETKAAQALVEAARLAQSATARREKETVIKVPLMPLSAVIDQGILLPKENWLAEFCRAEKARHRRTLVYVRQTGTRDIQDRVENVLRQAGLRAITLYSSVSPRRREAWIEKNSDTDVLITNPRLVQTGLDLVSFSSVVFFEIEYSLYTLWQSLRRVWRLGQTQPVKAVFAVYKDAMEAQALSLMGRKMRAAQMLYGDEVGGAIVPAEEGDFLTELAREVLGGAELEDLQSLFASEMQVSGSMLDYPLEESPLPITVPSLPLTWDDWIRQHQEARRISGRGKIKKRTRSTPGQLSIWNVMRED
jgi:SNF2 family DNA or RNA helicase